MRKDIADLWVSALNSGEYTQGRCSLGATVHGQNMFCCLGVLCELAVKAGVIPDPKPSIRLSGKDHVIYMYGSGEDMENRTSSVLPPVVMEWAGMKTNIGRYRGHDRRHTLAGLNDNAGKTFPEIAKVIAKHVEAL